MYRNLCALVLDRRNSIEVMKNIARLFVQQEQKYLDMDDKHESLEFYIL